MWEPGHDAGTAMNMLYTAHNDTIWVKAVQDTNTDEWDDDVLLHEFGHYLMKGYAQGPPTCYGPHEWAYEYPDKKGIGYGEGWAHFFSGRARVGSGTDSLIVSTYRGIGGGAATITWFNLENPWDNTVTIPEFFEGGPWCEGTVAGALWDIYDSHNEPYPSYPYPGFPDTALADTLTVDFDTIWTVFDDYNPPGEPTHCWTIFDFRSGWNSYNYGHQFALNQILLHHRIRDSIPDAPTGLSATLENYKVRLYWHKNSEPDLNGYRIYRRSKCLFVIPPQWSSWGIIAENSSPTDTTHLDTTVQRMYRYEYKLTAYDSLGNESEFSDSVSIDVIQKDQDKNSPPFVRNSVIKDIRQLVLMVPEGSHVLIVKIYDCTGRVIDRQELTFEKGFSGSVNICNRRGKNLPSGVYFVDIQNDNDLRVVEKIVIIK